MKTTKPQPSELPSSRRAQPLRQTRNNPPRSSVARAFGSRASLGDIHDPPSPEQPLEIFPAISHFADAITALPKELVRHFTLLKEVDAKIFTPEEDLGKLVDLALSTPLPERRQAQIEPQNAFAQTSAPISAQGSVNGSVVNGYGGSVASATDVVDQYNASTVPYDPANLPRRQLFSHCAITMQNMLVSLDEKNHVISTAGEALNKQLARLEDCFHYIETEISEEARYGSTEHWAYPENRIGKTAAGGGRREGAQSNNFTAATQALVDEAAHRSDLRKQALAAKKGRNQHAESDFDDHHDAKHRDSGKKVHGNTKVRKAVDSPLSVGLGITNGVGTNGNPPKRRKVEKGPGGGAVMERALSGVFGSNGTATKAKAKSPRETPQPEGTKKRARGGAATNGQTRKRNGTVNSLAMSPSIASSPIRSTFSDSKAGARGSPIPANGARPASARARQNSTHSVLENARQARPESSASNKQDTNGAPTPDLGTAAGVTGRSITEVKASMKESGTNSNGEHLLEDVEQQDPGMVGGLIVGNRKDGAMKHEEAESNGGAMQDIQTTTVTTTKSGRASKPATPAIPSFPEPVRSRSGRNGLETASNNKRSHKKGAGAVAQQLIAQQTLETDDAESSLQGDDDDGEIDANEPTYCYCNGVSYGEMVACDGAGCEKEWFHLECVGLKVAPKGNAKWYCDDCKERLKPKRFNSR